MNSFNQVTLLGNVGKEPEVKSTQSGQSVAKFSLATSTGGYKKPDGTEVKEVTQWHNIIVWGMEGLVKAIHKGHKVLVVGRIEYRSYQGADGQTKFVTEIIASNLSVLSRDGQAEQAPASPVSAPAPTDDDGLPF